jgi:hypothetical protein
MLKELILTWALGLSVAAYASPAGAECAGMIWQSGPTPSQRPSNILESDWSVVSAFPTYNACEQEVQAMTKSVVALIKAEVKRVDRTTSNRGQVLIRTERKCGEISFTAYGCFPDSVDPHRK